ncbi:MAG: VOC family protein [Moraxellaceae bacterium]|nr:VOC family protein [Moraxellaceae bacterium]
MKVHHVGYAVADIDIALSDFLDLGFSPVGERCLDEHRHIHIQFMRNDDYVIELVAPANERSPVGNLLKKVGNTPYHFCYETPDLVASIDRLKGRGFIVLAEPAEAPAIEIRRVAFLFKTGTGIVELLETS